MGRRLLTYLGRWLLAGAAVVVLAAGPSRAADGDQQTIEELKKRMEALEQQNQQLMTILKQIQPPAAAAPAVEATEPAADQDPDKVRSIVSDYLKEKDEDKKKKEEEDKKKAEAEGWEIGKLVNMSARWDNGLWFLETPDKAFRIHCGGRTQFDTVWLTAPGDVEFDPRGIVEDGFNFRRARLEVDGTLYETIDFWCEYDFENTTDTDESDELNVINTPVPTDLWITIKKIPWIGNIRIGNQKPPYSLEHMTSSRFLDFMERSFAFDAFVGGLNNGFEPGIQAFNWFANERATWAVGVFKHNSRVFGWNFGDGEYEVAGRVTWLPYYANEGRCLLHVGLGGYHADSDDDRIRYRARTLLRNGPPSTHTVMAVLDSDASGDTMLVPELLFQVGPFFIQGEYYAVFAHDLRYPHGEAPENQVSKSTGFYQGAYVQALYFLTGENRIYNRRYRENHRLATFDRVIPDENFFCVRSCDGGRLFGRGAWQVGARYSWIDLNSDPVSAGIVHDVTLGLNWFLNPNMKIQWNYIIEHRDMPYAQQQDGFGDATVQGFGMRLALDF